MQDFLHQKNLELYRKRLLETTDPAEREVLAPKKRGVGERRSRELRMAEHAQGGGLDGHRAKIPRASPARKPPRSRPIRRGKRG